MAAGQPREDQPLLQRRVPQWIGMHQNQEELRNEDQMLPQPAVLAVQNNNPLQLQVVPAVPIGNNHNNHGRNQQRVQNLDANIMQEFRHAVGQDSGIENDEVALERLRQQMQVLETMVLPPPPPPPCLHLDEVPQGHSTTSGNQI